MTLIEARDSGVKAVRKPYWNESAKLELPPRVGDGFGPWCKLYDVTLDEPMAVFFGNADDGLSDWEAIVE